MSYVRRLLRSDVVTTSMTTAAAGPETDELLAPRAGRYVYRIHVESGPKYRLVQSRLSVRVSDHPATVASCWSIPFTWGAPRSLATSWKLASVLSAAAPTPEATARTARPASARPRVPRRPGRPSRPGRWIRRPKPGRAATMARAATLDHTTGMTAGSGGLAGRAQV